jgi:hypothetical protein
MPGDINGLLTPCLSVLCWQEFHQQCKEHADFFLILSFKIWKHHFCALKVLCFVRYSEKFDVTECVCPSDQVVPFERFSPCFCWFTVLTTKPWLFVPDYFLILAFWWSIKSKILLFFATCPVLRIGNSLCL